MEMPSNSNIFMLVGKLSDAVHNDSAIYFILNFCETEDILFTRMLLKRCDWSLCLAPSESIIIDVSLL